MFRASALVTKIGLLLFNQQFHQSKYQGADIEFPTKCYAVNIFHGETKYFSLYRI